MNKKFSMFDSRRKKCTDCGCEFPFHGAEKKEANKCPMCDGTNIEEM